MKYTFILPAYNIEDYIVDCANSILNQLDKRRHDFEIIIVNDGSTDNTGYIIHRAFDNNENIKIIDQANGGLSLSRNKALKRSRGDYIFFVDGDDLINEDTLDSLISFVERCQSDVVWFDADSFTMKRESPFFRSGFNDDIIHENSVRLLKYFLNRDYSFGWCVWHYVFKRSFLINNGFIFEEGRLSEDVDFMLDVYLANCDMSCYTGRPVYKYRQSNDDSITRSPSYKFASDILHAVDKNINRIDEVYSYDAELGTLLKLNFETLIEVVLPLIKSFPATKQRNLLQETENILEVYNINDRFKKLQKRKERLVSRAIKSIGLKNTASIWNFYNKLRGR